MSHPPIVVSAFYEFVPVDDPGRLRDVLLQESRRCSMRGSILVAGEGINGTIAGTRPDTDAFFARLRSDVRFAELEVKESFTDAPPFLRMKVRLKKEIVTFRRPVRPLERVGTYIEPADWNEIISDPDVLVIDTRNQEEIAVGTFARAVDPGTESFVEFADYVATLDPAAHPRVAMFCTGGIRCEKATSYLLDQGFEDVMHLRGGILRYLEEIDPADSLWQGECFVFDERVTVDHDLRPGSYTLCRGCRHPLAPADVDDPAFEPGVSCAHCIGTLSTDKAERLRERHRQVQLAAARGVDHLARTDDNR